MDIDLNLSLLLVLLHLTISVSFMCYKTNTEDFNKIIKIHNEALLKSAALVFALTLILTNN